MSLNEIKIMQSGIIPFTEYEEGIMFDVDDPDFEPNECSPHRSHNQAQKSCSVEARVPPPLSNNYGNLNRSQSYDALAYVQQQCANEQPVLTIEELKAHLNSCFTCGVSWLEDHVSLDCPECGGYSLQRPCIKCNGQCDNIWQRDLSTTHSLGKAKWNGQCNLQKESNIPNDEKNNKKD